MSDNTEAQKILLDLYHHEIATCDIYKEVLSHIKDNKMYDQIKAFMGDHETHVRKLSETLDKISTKEVDKSRDMKGMLMSAYATLRSMTGQDGALKALQTLEGVILKRYQEAVKADLDNEFKKLIQTNLKDEERHNQYVDKAVSEI